MTTNSFEECGSFDDAGLRDDVLRGVQAMGFESPTAIQRRAMPPLLRGRDLLAQAACGTGKTAAYGIPLLQRVDPASPAVQAIVLVPARGLALQVCAVIEALGARAGVRALACVGGTDIEAGRSDVSLLRRGGVQVVVGTPARILDLVAQGSRPLRTSALRLIVLDEADQLVADGASFKDQVRDIFGCLPSAVQVAMFSATMTAEVLESAAKNLRAPAVVLAEAAALVPASIRHFAVTLDSDGDKADVLADIWHALGRADDGGAGGAAHAIAFCNSTARVEGLAEALRARGESAAVLHGGLGQAERERVLAEFRSRGGLLLATDLLARGLDVQQLQLVFNADLPTSREAYVHRTGRCGRCGRQGVAVSLVLASEERYLRDIEAAYHCRIEDLPADLAGLLPRQSQSKAPAQGKQPAAAPARVAVAERQASAAPSGAVVVATAAARPDVVGASAAAEARAAAAAEERARRAEARATAAEEALAAAESALAAARLAASAAEERAAVAEKLAVAESARAAASEALLVSAAAEALVARSAPRCTELDAKHPAAAPTKRIVDADVTPRSHPGSAVPQSCFSDDGSSVSAASDDGAFANGTEELWLLSRRPLVAQPAVTMPQQKVTACVASAAVTAPPPCPVTAVTVPGKHHAWVAPAPAAVASARLPVAVAAVVVAPSAVPTGAEGSNQQQQEQQRRELPADDGAWTTVVSSGSRRNEVAAAAASAKPPLQSRSGRARGDSGRWHAGGAVIGGPGPAFDRRQQQQPQGRASAGATLAGSAGGIASVLPRGAKVARPVAAAAH